MVIAKPRSVDAYPHELSEASGLDAPVRRRGPSAGPRSPSAALTGLAPKSSLLARVRLICLVLAIAGIVQIIPAILGAHQPPMVRAGAVALAVGLACYWVWGFKHGDFPLIAEPAEVMAVYLLLHLASGNPLLPLFGVALHSLYGRQDMVWARYGYWMMALLAAHAGRGTAQLSGDLARAAGTAMVPAFFKFLRTAVVRVEASERRLASLVQNSTDVLTVIGEDLRIHWQAGPIGKVLGLDPSSMIGMPLPELVHPDDLPRLHEYLAAVGDQPTRTLDLRLRRDDGQWSHFEAAISDRRSDTAVGGYVLNMRDTTDRLALEHDLRVLAQERERDSLLDPLTGLPNRRSLFESLEQEIARGIRFALLLIDIDHFKELNDALGHQVGDQLLREIWPHLLGSGRELDAVARLGGDEFAVVVPLSASGDTPEQIAEVLRTALGRPFAFQGLTLLVEASIGIAIHPDHGNGAEILLQRAEVAMYASKRARSGYAVYVADADQHSRERLALLGELPRALASNELVVHFQPKFDLQSGALAGAEALVRWQHPVHGLLYPDAFLSLAEQTGLMQLITLRVLDEALRQCAAWRAQGILIPVAVNLSARDLMDAELPDRVERLLHRWNVEPSELQLELTERIVTSDPAHLGEVLAGLRAKGVELSLDDFGTGSSSLSRLRELPVTELKIDKSFVFAMSRGDPRDIALVRTILTLAHDLGLRVLAEGIESDLDRQRLTAWGCDQGQGFALARPMAAQQLTELAQQFAALAAAPASAVAGKGAGLAHR
jgi:diguanylate cyclase (GGDEF)-like protein/PAS domain S-box-containing protein